MKPPTSQEMNALRETENLFHSNLFKLQVCHFFLNSVRKFLFNIVFAFVAVRFTIQAEDILTDIRLKPKRKLEVDEWIKKLKDTISGFPNSGSHNVRTTD